jgi:hypothetical protein
MPARIQPNRPYYPRYYLPRRAPQPRGGGGGGGAKGGAKGAFGGGVDTSSTGNIGGDLAKAVINTMLQNRQNAAANAIMNTQTPPRAGAVGPVVDPASGQVTGNITPTVGTAPQTGGIGELQMRQQMAQEDAAAQAQKVAAQRADLADQLTKARIATEVARAQGTGGFAKQPKAAATQKPQKYEPLSSTPNDASYYNFNNQRADIDAQYGKGTYDKLLAASGKVDIDSATGKPKPGVYGEGNDAVTVTKDGSISLAKGATIPADHLPAIMARYDATKVRQGGKPSYIGQYLGTQNPQTGEDGGSSANPYTPKTTVELNALPPGTWFVNPNDGKTYQKGGTPQPSDQGGQKTSQADTSDQAQVADVTQPQQPPIQAQPPPQLADLTPSSTPGAFDLGTLPTGGLPDTTSLGDELAKARAADFLRGLA